MTGLPVATALVAGLIHALEADHVAAVTTFVSRRPHPVRAMGFGVRWGLGHSIALLVVGGALVLLGLEIPLEMVRGMEVAVGAMLVGLGLWAAAGVRQGSPRGTAHADAHPGRVPHSHRIEEGSGWVGAAHGVAGTAGFLALVPALLLASPWTAGGYLVLFGIGTVVAMGGYGLLAGLLFHRASASAPSVLKPMRLITAAASVCIGVAWMAGALG